MPLHISGLIVTPGVGSSNVTSAEIEFLAWNDESNIKATFALRIGDDQRAFLRDANGQDVSEVTFEKSVATKSDTYKEAITVVITGDPTTQLDLGLQLSKKKPDQQGTIRTPFIYVPSASRSGLVSRANPPKKRLSTTRGPRKKRKQE